MDKIINVQIVRKLIEQSASTKNQTSVLKALDKQYPNVSFAHTTVFNDIYLTHHPVFKNDGTKIANNREEWLKEKIKELGNWPAVKIWLDNQEGLCCVEFKGKKYGIATQWGNEPHQTLLISYIVASPYELRSIYNPDYIHDEEVFLNGSNLKYIGEPDFSVPDAIKDFKYENLASKKAYFAEDKEKCAANINKDLAQIKEDNELLYGVVLANLSMKNNENCPQTSFNILAPILAEATLKVKEMQKGE